MSKFPKIILLVVATAVSGWFLPWLYALMTPSPSGEPFCAFSPVSGQWIASRTAPGEKPVITALPPFPEKGAVTGTQGDTISIAMRDSLVPQLFYRQLVAHDQLPDTIAGMEVTPHLLKSHEIFFTSSPRDINKRSPRLWLMMESMPLRVDLSDPEEAFRFTSGGIEFVRIADNTVNTSRSRWFTEAMKSRGFSFPGVDLSANITSQKSYDEGYLIIDSEGKLFHIKQRGGRPFVASVKMPDGVKASKTFIWEESDRSLLGFMVDTEGHPYIIKTDGHVAVPLPYEAGTVDPRKESIMVMKNLFNLTARFSGAEDTRWRTFDADSLSLIGSLDFPKEKSTASEIARYIFPFTISYTSVRDSLAYPRVTNLSLAALPLNLLLSLTLLFWGIRRKDPMMKWGALMTVALGVFSFLSVILFRE